MLLFSQLDFYAMKDKIVENAARFMARMPQCMHNKQWAQRGTALHVTLIFKGCGRSLSAATATRSSGIATSCSRA
jgi:hypothetical protein